ncbi:YbcC family protein [Dyadobacter pollutisoli]|uniref:Probable inorganic carbon transporter subunit DabA n=1 Tax=Dyadobacter pollutisoli TaxID=2910158 RepID=A0A9E8NAH9_9BACT|nr:DUF2309 domain-containing protein [Dyadobacter pollutisoli]WAC12368.1 DUF2309 domain-containing protein [Dyadobacter pollutisoli]
MEAHKKSFDEHEVLHELKHFLPAQAPLKNFIHHNTLHAFQTFKFHDGLRRASEIFGYKVSLSIEEYRALFNAKRITQDILEKVLLEKKGASNTIEWRDKVLFKKFLPSASPRIGALKANWMRQYRIDLDSVVHPILFRILCSYLDQGISIWNFPVREKGFLASIREMEENSFVSIFKTNRAKNLLLYTECSISDLLAVVVGDESLYEQYLFDQQFAHQGWSGMVSAIEDQPETLLDTRKITLHDLICFELLLEIDALDRHFKENWTPLAGKITEKPVELFTEVAATEMSEVISIWQEAFEWTYYDQVLAAIKNQKKEIKAIEAKTFQAIFCIDDREGSLRRCLEEFDPQCETFGTPGFFGVEFYYQPEEGKFYTKVCPAPVTPKYLIKEIGSTTKRTQDAHFSKHSHSFRSGWLVSKTLGFWSAFKLAAHIFRPSVTPAAASYLKHMDRFSKLTIENKSLDDRENGLQIGFTIEEMADRVESVLKSIGLVKNFAPIVYVIGHGSSSVNNPHYAAYDCAACAGRAGSVNSRVLSYMANSDSVRTILHSRGITIPPETQFVGGLHDTTRDEVVFYDETSLSPANHEGHKINEAVLMKALDYNAKERSRRFEFIDTSLSPQKIHCKMRLRSLSLFEPRPELNHATNALCIIGRRNLTKNLFLDRRAFMNSYDYSIDPEGNYLFNVLKTAAPVCGGINLEYFFSRVDNHKLGAGTKLAHNVMGLFGVANGIDGDLRPGLPSEMIEIHDPVRLLFIVEQFPEVILNVIQRLYAVYEWFINEWIHLVAANPETHELSVFKNGEFVPYSTRLFHTLKILAIGG